MNWFLEAVHDGDHCLVETALTNCDQPTKDLLLGSTTLGGFGPARVAMEVNDEQMIEIILAHAGYKSFLERGTASDRKTDFETALAMNPVWFDRFLEFGESKETLLEFAVRIPKLSVKPQFKHIWDMFATVEIGQAARFMMNAIKRRDRELSQHLWNFHGHRLPDDKLLDLAVASIGYSDVKLFQHIFPNLTSSSSMIFPHIAVSGQQELFEIFLQGGSKITKRDVDLICQDDDVKTCFVEAVLSTGIMGDGITVSEETDMSKWELFLKAGFFIESETKALRIAPKAKENTSNNFPCLATMAVVQVRKNLLAAFKQNLFFLCRENKLHLPEVVCNEIREPYSQEQIIMIKTFFHSAPENVAFPCPVLGA